MEHELLIQRCLDLAINGLGKVSPNPMVGCVITDDQGTILSEGFHQAFGGPHAEVHAFNNLQGTLPVGARLYVNLEPCNHHGKTPPCTDRIIASGIKEVYIADADPNPLVSGKGIDTLREAGIKVEVGYLRKEAAQLNRTFYCEHILKRPFYRLKWAQTANGKMGNEKYASPGEQKITQEPAQILSHRWRTEFDAILVGVNTILTDDPKLNARYWPGKNPVIIVLDPNNRIPHHAAILSGESRVLIFNATSDERTAHVSRIKIDFHQWLPELNRHLLEEKIQSVIVEGGLKTLQAFIDADVWDECAIFESPETRNWSISAPAIQGKTVWRQAVGNDLFTLMHRNA